MRKPKSILCEKNQHIDVLWRQTRAHSINYQSRGGEHSLRWHGGGGDNQVLLCQNAQFFVPIPV